MSSKLTLLIFAATMVLTACAPFKPVTPAAGVCNELNSQVIFSGNTSDTRKAEIENAESPLSQQNFDRHCS